MYIIIDRVVNSNEVLGLLEIKEYNKDNYLILFSISRYMRFMKR